MDDIEIEDPPGWIDGAPSTDRAARPGAERIWAGLGRPKGPRAAGGKSPDLAAKLAAMYGTGRQGRPDTRKAAGALGVSQRTVQRWVAEGKASTKRAQDVDSAYDKWRKDPARRSEAMNPRREARMRKSGTNIRFAGMVQISSDKRRRAKEIFIDGEHLGPILDAAMAGDDQAAHDAFEAFVIAQGIFGGECSLDIDIFETRG